MKDGEFDEGLAINRSVGKEGSGGGKEVRFGESVEMRGSSDGLGGGGPPGVGAVQEQAPIGKRASLLHTTTAAGLNLLTTTAARGGRASSRARKSIFGAGSPGEPNTAGELWGGNRVVLLGTGTG